MKFCIKRNVGEFILKAIGVESNLESLKAEVIAILKKNEKKIDDVDLKKAIEYFQLDEEKYTHIEKSVAGDWIQKAGYGVGTVRIWKGKKYKKVSASPVKWVRVFDKMDRGAKSSMTRLINRVKACKSEEELLQFCMSNHSLFQDDNGVDLPIMDKLRSAIEEQKGKNANSSSKVLDAVNKYNQKLEAHQNNIANTLTSDNSADWENNKNKTEQSSKELKDAKKEMDEAFEKEEKERAKENEKDLNSRFNAVYKKAKEILEERVKDGTAEAQVHNKTPLQLQKFIDTLDMSDADMKAQWKIDEDYNKWANFKARRDVLLPIAKKELEKIRNTGPDAKKGISQKSKDTILKMASGHSVTRMSELIAGGSLGDEIKKEFKNYNNGDITRFVAKLYEDNNLDVSGDKKESTKAPAKTKDEAIRKDAKDAGLLNGEDLKNAVKDFMDKNRIPYGNNIKLAKNGTEVWIKTNTGNRVITDEEFANDSKDENFASSIAGAILSDDAFDSWYDGKKFNKDTQEWETPESEAEKHQNRSDAMKGNQNAYKGTSVEKAVEQYATDKVIKNTINKISDEDLASTDEARWFMNGVYHEDGYNIATDGRILSMIKSDYPDSENGKISATKKALKYNEKLVNSLQKKLNLAEAELEVEKKRGQGTHAYKYAEENVKTAKENIEKAKKTTETGYIDGAFPKYQRVIPSLGNSELVTPKGFEDYNKILKIAKVASAYQKQNGQCAVKIGDRFFDPDLLTKCVAMAEKHGLKNVITDARRDNGAIEFNGDKGSVVMMPKQSQNVTFDAETGKVESIDDVDIKENVKNFLGTSIKKSIFGDLDFELIPIEDEEPEFDDFDASEPEDFNSIKYKVAQAIKECCC